MSGEQSATESARVDEFDAQLQVLRDRIDSIDAQLLGLLNARAAVVGHVYALKRLHGVQRLDRARTNAILDNLVRASTGPLGPNDVRALFAPLLKYFVERYVPPEEPAPTAHVSGN